MTKTKLKARKIAFLGSASSSRSLAPFDDPEWEVWATGPGCHNDPAFKSQFDRWFEFHDMSENDPQYGTVLDANYFEWLQVLGKDKTKTLYYRPPIYPGLTGVEFPWDEMVKKHNSFFLDSTVAEMMSFAYDYFLDDIDEIGIWGIDFATEPERVAQRPGTKHFIELFRFAGVPCYIPDVSEMSFDPPPYPLDSKLGAKIRNQIMLLTPEKDKTDKLITDLEKQVSELKLHQKRIEGTMQTLNHFKENFT